MDVQSNGLSGTGIAMPQYIGISLLNPANHQNEYQPLKISLFHANLFSIKELSLQRISIKLSTFKNVKPILFHYTHFGTNHIYQEQTISIAHSLNLSQYFSVGYQINSMFLKIKEFGDTSFSSLDITGTVRIHENFILAFVAHHVIQYEVQNHLYTLPIDIVIGSYTRVSSNVEFMFDIEKDGYDILQLRQGLRIHVLNIIYVLFGWQIEPSQYSYGIELNTNRVSIHYAYTFNVNISGYHLFNFVFCI